MMMEMDVREGMGVVQVEGVMVEVDKVAVVTVEVVMVVVMVEVGVETSSQVQTRLAAAAPTTQTKVATTDSRKIRKEAVAGQLTSALSMLPPS